MSNVTTTQQPNKNALILAIDNDQFKTQLERVLPKIMNAESFVRVAITTLRKTPKLMKCTQESFMSCMLRLSEFGLAANGRQAHLVPFGEECTLIVDYRGLVELALRSGQVSNIHADVIFSGDFFRYNKGVVIDHIPWFIRDDDRKPKEKGPIIGAYSLVNNSDGSQRAELMDTDSIESVRRRSRSSGSGPWVTDWSEMAKKTTFRRLSKWITLSPEVREAIDGDDDGVIETTAVIKKQSVPKKLSDIGSKRIEKQEEPEQSDEEPADELPEEPETHDEEVEKHKDLPRETQKTPEKTVDDRQSNMDECLTWVRGQVGVGVSVDGKVENGRVTVILPNNMELILTESPIRPLPIGPTVIDVRDVDAMVQVRNTYDHNKVKKAK